MISQSVTPEQAAVCKEMMSLIRNEALDRCYGPRVLVGQIAGGIVAVGGGAILGVFIPGYGQYIGIALGIAIAGAISDSVSRDGDRIEAFDGTTINRYLPPTDQASLLEPYQGLFEDGGKKTSPNLGQNQNQPASKSGTNQWVDTSPQPESDVPAQASGSPQEGSGDGTSKSKSGLPIKPVELDSAAPHLFMVGRTREGKSETLKHLIGGEKRVWYLTSKATDKVPEHWIGYRVGGPDLGKQITWLLDQWEDSFLHHLELIDSNREWFVIDEAVGILQSLKTKKAKDVAERLRGFIVEVITAGAAVGAFAGILSQTGNAGPIGVDEDLLKNFSIVGCGKRKKAQMLKAFLKLTDLKVTPDDEKDILMRDGYWQLWENNGVCLSQVPLSNLSLKEVEKCPVDESEIESTDIKEEEETLEGRILRHLRKHGEARTVREIRNAVTNNRDQERASTDEVKIILQQLINLEKVQRWADGSSDRYQATGTV